MLNWQQTIAVFLLVIAIFMIGLYLGSTYGEANGKEAQAKKDKILIDSLRKEVAFQGEMLDYYRKYKRK